MTEAHPHYTEPKNPLPAAELVATLADGTRVYRRVPRMRACGQHGEKGKLCHGHLKRWFGLNTELRERFGESAEVYRCERCKVLYLPNPQEKARTRTLSW